MFVNVIYAHYGVIYVTFSTTTYKIIKILLNSFIWYFFQYTFKIKISCLWNLLTIPKMQTACFYHKKLQEL